MFISLFFPLNDIKVNYINEFVTECAFIYLSCANSACTTWYFKPLSSTSVTKGFPRSCNSGLCCTNSPRDGGNRPISSRWFGEACVIRTAPWVTVKANSDPYHNRLILECNHSTITNFKQTGGSGWVIVSYHNLLWGTPVQCARLHPPTWAPETVR